MTGRGTRGIGDGATGGWPPGLPVALTLFIGRKDELAEAARLIAAHRLVTLVGRAGWERPLLCMAGCSSWRCSL